MIDEKLRLLRSLFADVFVGDKLSIERLRKVLGDAISDTEYGLTWVGKQQMLREIDEQNETTILRHDEGLGVDEDTTNNMVIVGDNLLALRALQNSYEKTVKLIYIDPPYNTGKDFIYKDNFTMTKKAYRQAYRHGRLVPNPQSSGRFHSNWLNFMYPRLKAARSLLRDDDGTIFVSINDNEVHSLKLMMDEIFGHESFIACFVWKSRQNKDNRTTTGASIDHEYVLCYGCRIRGDARNKNQYSNPDGDPRGNWTSANMVGIATKDRRPNLHYDLVNPSTGINYGCPTMGWRYVRSTMSRLVTEDLILWPADSHGRPRRKKFISEFDSEFTGFSSIIGEDLYTKHGTSDVESLFGGRVFDFPKPVDLIRMLLQQGATADDVILDFFAGSGTTGEAVMRLNSEDGGNRKYILIQIDAAVSPESHAASAGYQTIDKITCERLRRVSKAMKAEGVKGDLGFRVYRLDNNAAKG